MLSLSKDDKCPEHAAHDPKNAAEAAPANLMDLSRSYNPQRDRARAIMLMATSKAAAAFFRRAEATCSSFDRLRTTLSNVKSRRECTASRGSAWRDLRA